MRLEVVLRSVLLGLPIGVTCFDSFGYVAKVDGLSMQPVLNPDPAVNDYVFLKRWALDVNRGDIVSLSSPKDPRQKLIKRVVGLEGDVIATLCYRKPFVKVPTGHCWVEGDHAGHSLDSNHFGPVSRGLIQAKATWIVWPPSRWQLLKSQVPPGRLPVNLNSHS